MTVTPQHAVQQCHACDHYATHSLARKLVIPVMQSKHYYRQGGHHYVTHAPNRTPKRTQSMSSMFCKACRAPDTLQTPAPELLLLHTACSNAKQRHACAHKARTPEQSLSKRNAVHAGACLVRLLLHSTHYECWEHQPLHYCAQVMEADYAKHSPPKSIRACKACRALETLLSVETLQSTHITPVPAVVRLG